LVASVTDEWYSAGLRFKCTGCGQCCTGAPGYVWVNESEIAEMAAFLKISREEFIKKFTRRVDGHLCLLERQVPNNPSSYDCIFLKEKLCQVYAARPRQCRTFPWWPEQLKSREDWEEVARRCEGINHEDAPLISIEEIKSRM
jgi:uncharacterized protein